MFNNTNTPNNMPNSADVMGVKEYVTDILGSEKRLCDTYNTAIVESATPNIRNNFKTVLMDQFDIQNSIFCAMNERGWYPVESADTTKVDEVKNQFPNSVANSSNNN